MPDAIAGQGGHDQTYAVAVALAHGFALSEADSWAILDEYNRTRCQPPWTEAELRHKLSDAVNRAHDKPRGHLLGGSPARAAQPWKPSPRPAPPRLVQSAEPPKPIENTYHLPEAPIADGARELLKACFQEGEGVRIVGARLNEDGKEVPDGEGPCLSREEWLRKLDKRDGDPNGIWRNEERTGIYIAINPLRVGGSKDADVSAYRHVLIEFDKTLSIEEQWNLYLQTKLPCSAVIYSGGQSLHAWVRVDARDRAEYDERVKILQEHFAPYGVDGKNKNPSRLSRLPNCMRFDKRQELYALNIGASSFMEWMAEREVDGLGEQVDLGALLNFDKDNDPSCLLGNRWVCKGGSCLLISQSGVGKSSLLMQLTMLWALGRAAFGICPVRPLKSLVVQHENDDGDLGEMFQGVIEGLGLHAEPETVLKLRDNLIIVRNRSHAGADFVHVLRRLIERHQPDLVWIDPIYSYIGGDISKADVCTDFLVRGLGPITEASRVAWMFIHHTPRGRINLLLWCAR
jgi:hypothetical protein